MWEWRMYGVRRVGSEGGEEGMGKGTGCEEEGKKRRRGGVKRGIRKIWVMDEEEKREAETCVYSSIENRGMEARGQPCAMRDPPHHFSHFSHVSHVSHIGVLPFLLT